MITITLTDEEIDLARFCGAQRIAMAADDPARFAYVAKNGMDSHSIGCMGELAAAKAIGTLWPARVEEYRRLPDLDPNWEVRWSPNPRVVKIAVDDDPDIMVVHVTGQEPTFDIHGFIVAGVVQRTRPLMDPGGKGWEAYFWPANRLTPINEDFHLVGDSVLHAWGQLKGSWICLYCGDPYVGPLPGKETL